MTALTWPSSLIPASCDIGLKRQTVQHQSQITSQVQAVELGTELWRMSVTMPPRMRADSGAMEAFFNQLVGGVQTVTAWHFSRPTPKGTMRGAPTVAANAAQFARSIQITTTGTLLAGDMFAIGSQLFQVAADASPVAGVLTVTTVNRVKAAITSGAVVVWYRPSASFIVTEDQSAFTHTPDTMASSSYTLIESP